VALAPCDLDGQPVRACTTPVSVAVGKRVTTIEAMSGTRTGRAVQAAWDGRTTVPQCGYCQSGQNHERLLRAAAANSSLADTDIDAAMSGNICRCGTYNQIRAAIKDAAGQLQKGA